MTSLAETMEKYGHSIPHFAVDFNKVIRGKGRKNYLTVPEIKCLFELHKHIENCELQIWHEFTGQGQTPELKWIAHDHKFDKMSSILIGIEALERMGV